MFLDLLKQELGDNKSAGNETRFNCPFCGNMKHKFYVDSEKGLWICFKCSESGNPVSFVMKYYGVPFEEAADILATYDYDVTSYKQQNLSLTQYGVDLTDEERLLLFVTRRGEPLEQDNEIIYTCPPPPTNCKPLMANFNNPEAFPFFTYLRFRGVTLEQIQEHNISYVTNGEVELTDGRKMTLVNHIVFFAFNEKRIPLYWNTRSIEQNPLIKSFNAPAKISEYSKNNVVFNLNRAKDCNRIIIHEGVFDALTIGQEGVATYGKKVTEEQVRLLVAASKAPIYLYLDRNATREMIATAHLIKSIDPGRYVYYVYSPNDDDANTLGRDKAYELINNALLADSEGDLKLQVWTM